MWLLIFFFFFVRDCVFIILILPTVFRVGTLLLVRFRFLAAHHKTTARSCKIFYCRCTVDCCHGKIVFHHFPTLSIAAEFSSRARGYRPLASPVATRLPTIGRHRRRRAFATLINDSRRQLLLLPYSSKDDLQRNRNNIMRISIG